MTTRATSDQMDDLHNLVTTTIVEEIKRCKAEANHVPPQLLACANKLLKHNGVDTPARAVSARDALAWFLPDFGEDL